MLLDCDVISWDGYSINNSNYRAYIPPDAALLADAQILSVPRSGNTPQFAGKAFGGRNLPLVIKIVGDYDTRMEELAGWGMFNNLDLTLHKLMVRDRNNYKDWYVMATVVGMPRLRDDLLSVTLWLPDPVWRSNLTLPDTWPITATGAKRGINIGGNMPSFPVFKVTPTGTGSNGYAKQQFIAVYNPIAKAFDNWGFEMTKGGMDTAALIADPNRRVQINKTGGMSATDTTIPIDTPVGDDLPASGMAYLGTEQIYYSVNTGSNLTGCIRGFGGTTAAIHADNTIIRPSLMQANGADWAYMIDGVIVDRHLADINTNHSKAWAVFSLAPKIDLTLGTAIANSGIIGEIQLQATNANRTALAGLNTPCLYQFGSEVFSITAKDPKTLKLAVGERAARNTSMGTHTVGEVGHYIQHDIWLLYGDPNATLPETDDTRKPVFDLSLSTNTHRVYSIFADEAGLRSGAWKPSLTTKGKISHFYPGSHGDMEADPATEMGMEMDAWQISSRWQGETATLMWQLYCPCGITQISSNGEKFRISTTWPVLAGLDRSINGINWINVWKETTPVTGSSWTAWNRANAALTGNPPYVRFVFSGSIAAVANNQVNFEILEVTLDLLSTQVPVITITPEETNYQLDMEIKNNRTGESFAVSYPMKLNKTLTIDTNKKTVLYEGALVRYIPKFSSDRLNWLQLLPGNNAMLTTGANELEYTAVGTGNVTIVTETQDRMNI